MFPQVHIVENFHFSVLKSMMMDYPQSSADLDLLIDCLGPILMETQRVWVWDWIHLDFLRCPGSWRMDNIPEE